MSEVKDKPVTFFMEQTIYDKVSEKEKNLSSYVRRLIYRDVEQRGVMTADELRKVLQ